jgi:YrbI family 3-deoxy-D-manno-octulosonate 8-phosphate phosphatase
MIESIQKKIKKIKLILTDVDGVLTDGGMFYTKDGEFMKKFNTRDSMGMEILLKYGVKTVFVTRENSEIVKKRIEKIKVADLYSGIADKKSLLPIIMKKYNVKKDEIAYIGDDVNDIEIMKMVAFSATPFDGNFDVKKISHYRCKTKGGEGAFREIADLIINSKK